MRILNLDIFYRILFFISLHCSNFRKEKKKNQSTVKGNKCIIKISSVFLFLWDFKETAFFLYILIFILKLAIFQNYWIFFSFEFFAQLKKLLLCQLTPPPPHTQKLGEILFILKSKLNFHPLLPSCGRSWWCDRLCYYGNAIWKCS